MEHNLRFGLVLGQLAVVKKPFCGDYEQFLMAFFHVLRLHSNLHLFSNLIISPGKISILEALEDLVVQEVSKKFIKVV